MTILLACLAVGAGTTRSEERAGEEPALPSAADLEAAGAVIGEVIYARQNIFDLTNPAENNALYRLANRLHIVTREAVIRNQLLFRPGDRFSKRRVEESERLLRQNAYLYDAKIEPVRYENGVVDVRVRTRDVWTLIPGLSLSRSGGENRSKATLSERNLLGRGVSLRLDYAKNVDRESTSFAYYDRNLGHSWTSLFFELTDSSDGDTADLRVIRPFYELDARWSAGVTMFEDKRDETFYELGDEAAEYSVSRDFHSAFYGWSRGLRDGWARRWTAGFVYDDNQFSAVPGGTLPAVLPEDRKLVYPTIGFEVLEDRFESTSNRDQIDRTEDFYLGTRFTAMLGYASESFGADRDSFLYRFGLSTGYGSMTNKALLLSGSLAGRIDDGHSANRRVGAEARYYNQISDKRLFFMELRGTAGDNLDLDSPLELGGDNGLRGYPLRYQTGESSLLFTIEQRYYTNWYPFRLFRVGGAAFADVGRVWGADPVGGQRFGWLKDVGFGLRLVPTRASGRDVIHIDVAFPLDGDPSINSVQFIIESKRGF